MSEQRVETTRTPHVTVHSHGQLYVRSWDQSAVLAICAGDDCSTTSDGDQVRVDGESRLELRVPPGASLELTGSDDITVREVMGAVRVKQAGVCLILRDTGPVTVDSVGNDLTARGVDGDLIAGQVGRFLNARSISGDLKVESAGSHANVKDIGGSLSLDTEGNANLQLDVQAGQTAQVKAAGVITCRVAPGLNARVEINSREPISVRVGESRETGRAGRYEKVFGDGGAQLILTAEGPVSLVESRAEGSPVDFKFDFNFGEDMADVGAGFGEQISEQLEMIEEEFKTRFSGFSDMVSNWELSSDKAEQIQRRTQEKINRAQEKIRAAQERAAQKIADAQRRAESAARRAENAAGRGSRRSFNINLGDLKRTAKSSSEPVSDSERLMILNMVAEKKISLEQAEQLLAALEGK